MDRVDIAKTAYDPQLSRVPELIGRHPGVIAPLVLWKPNPLQLLKPASGSRVQGIMEVELKIREGNEELQKNLQKIILTIDGRRFEFDKPFCRIIDKCQDIVDRKMCQQIVDIGHRLIYPSVICL